MGFVWDWGDNIASVTLGRRYKRMGSYNGRCDCRGRADRLRMRIMIWPHAHVTTTTCLIRGDYLNCFLDTHHDNAHGTKSLTGYFSSRYAQALPSLPCRQNIHNRIPAWSHSFLFTPCVEKVMSHWWDCNFTWAPVLVSFQHDMFGYRCELGTIFLIRLVHGRVFKKSCNLIV